MILASDPSVQDSGLRCGAPATAATKLQQDASRLRKDIACGNVVGSSLKSPCQKLDYPLGFGRTCSAPCGVATGPLPTTACVWVSTESWVVVMDSGAERKATPEPSIGADGARWRKAARRWMFGFQCSFVFRRRLSEPRYLFIAHASSIKPAETCTTTALKAAPAHGTNPIDEPCRRRVFASSATAVATARALLRLVGPLGAQQLRV